MDEMLQVENEARIARANMVSLDECPYADEQGERWRQAWRDEPAPALDCEANRLGESVLRRFGSEIRQFERDGKPVKYFAWDFSECRTFGSLDDAAEWLGYSKPVGCADWFGLERLGRRVDGNVYGEIWKHTSGTLVMYFVWGGFGCVEYGTMAEARKLLSMAPAKSKLTAPKLSYAVNQKGYKR